MTTTPLQATIDLDVAPLDPTCEFYRRLLGFRVIHTENPGAFTEARTLASDEVPAVRLRLRCCSPRPPMGSGIGTIRLITFHVSDPIGVAARIDNPVWILPPSGDAPDRVILQDSSGYHVALARSQEGSACSDASLPGTGASSSPAPTS